GLSEQVSVSNIIDTVMEIQLACFNPMSMSELEVFLSPFLGYTGAQMQLILRKILQCTNHCFNVLGHHEGAHVDQRFCAWPSRMACMIKLWWPIGNHVYRPASQMMFANQPLRRFGDGGDGISPIKQ